MDFVCKNFHKNSNDSLPSNNMRILDYSELNEVNGGLGTVAIGAMVGAGWNAYQYIGSGSPNGFSEFLMATGSGAVGGAIAGMGGFGFAFYGGGIAAVGSMAASGGWAPRTYQLQ